MFFRVKMVFQWPLPSTPAIVCLRICRATAMMRGQTLLAREERPFRLLKLQALSKQAFLSSSSSSRQLDRKIIIHCCWGKRWGASCTTWPIDSLWTVNWPWPSVPIPFHWVEAVYSLSSHRHCPQPCSMLLAKQAQQGRLLIILPIKHIIHSPSPLTHPAVHQRSHHPHRCTHSSTTTRCSRRRRAFSAVVNWSSPTTPSLVPRALGPTSMSCPMWMWTMLSKCWSRSGPCPCPGSFCSCWPIWRRFPATMWISGKWMPSRRAWWK